LFFFLQKEELVNGKTKQSVCSFMMKQSQSKKIGS